MPEDALGFDAAVDPPVSVGVRRGDDAGLEVEPACGRVGGGGGAKLGKVLRRLLLVLGRAGRLDRSLTVCTDVLRDPCAAPLRSQGR